MRERLIDARKKKGYSVPNLAKELDISSSFCYKIEEGIRNPTMELAKRFADLLGATVDEIFFGDKLDETSKRPFA